MMSHEPVHRMLVNLSSDVPVFADEARGALHRAGPQLYDGAKKALSNAMAQKKKGASKRSQHATTVKRGHLNQQSVDILVLSDSMASPLRRCCNHPYWRT